jgi:SAM-dependent methyltransferase
MSADPRPLGPTLITVDRCVCGAALPAAPSTIIRPAPWGELRFVRCDDCGTHVQTPTPDGAWLAAWFSSQEYQGGAGRHGSAYHDYRADEASRRIEARERCRRQIARRLRPGARVLEVGCATGSLLAELRDQGHEVAGIDLSPGFAALARELNDLDLWVGDFLDYPEDRGPFDAVVLLGTISNLRDLDRQLDKISRLLTPDGSLFVNFPATDGWPARLYGRRYWMFAPSVAAFMSRGGCRRALERAGFAIREITTDRQRPSLGKLATHVGLRGALPLLDRLGLSSLAIPVAIPIPGVWFIDASPREQ